MIARWFGFLALSIVNSPSALAFSPEAPLLSAVRNNVEHTATCLQSGKYAEAKAYAELTLVARPVSYTVFGDDQGIAQEALVIWQQAIGRDLVFSETRPGLADLHISFKPRVSAIGHDVCGLAVHRRKVRSWGRDSFTYSLTGSIEVATIAPNGVAMSRAAKLNVALHEVGHILGLDDSPTMGGVMSNVDPCRPVTLPSPFECASILELRDRATMLFQQAQVSALNWPMFAR